LYALLSKVDKYKFILIILNALLLFVSDNSDVSNIALHQKQSNFLNIPAASARFGLLIETILIIIASTGSLLLTLLTNGTSQRRMSDIDSKKR